MGKELTCFPPPTSCIVTPINSEQTAPPSPAPSFLVSSQCNIKFGRFSHMWTVKDLLLLEGACQILPPLTQWYTSASPTLQCSSALPSTFPLPLSPYFYNPGSGRAVEGGRLTEVGAPTCCLRWLQQLASGMGRPCNLAFSKPAINRWKRRGFKKQNCKLKKWEHWTGLTLRRGEGKASFVFVDFMLRYVISNTSNCKFWHGKCMSRIALSGGRISVLTYIEIHYKEEKKQLFSLSMADSTGKGVSFAQSKLKTKYLEKLFILAE